MTNMTNQTIAALILQMQEDNTKIGEALKEASDCMLTVARGQRDGNRNGAVGALLMTEAEIERMASLFHTILTLHRTARG